MYEGFCKCSTGSREPNGRMSGQHERRLHTLRLLGTIKNGNKGHDGTTFQIQIENINKLDYVPQRASQVILMVKNPLANAGDVRDPGSIPGLGRSPGGGHGNPLQYSSLENRMDRGAWWATVHGVAKSWTWLK